MTSVCLFVCIYLKDDSEGDDFEPADSNLDEVEDDWTDRRTGQTDGQTDRQTPD